MAKNIEEKYKKLDDISHVLQRNSMYIGSIKPHTADKWIIEEGRMIQKQITYNPGFLKIFDEIITNSVDESKRIGTKLNIIKVSIENNIISIWDNGGIPVVKHKEHGEWIPEMIFSNLKAGSNFDDSEERSWAGTNGVGSTLTNIFSKKFVISTCDGKNQFDQTFTNNMRERTKVKVKKATRNHTEISYLPDFERFGIDSIDESHFKMLEKRVYDIAASNPTLKVYFNGHLINFKSFEDYIKLYTENYFYDTKKDKTWSIGISLSENGFQQVSFVNSTDTYDGGTHLDYVLNQIISALREFFSKKHKVDVKPSELKNHMFVFLNSTVINPAFSSQTKEKLITETKEFGSTFEVSSKLIQSILKSEIVASILDWIEQKKNADENKAARELNKNLAKIKVDKLIDAKGKDRWKCSLAIFEGDSASSAFRKYRDTNTQGAFSLRGKFINAAEITNQKLVANNEVINLMGAMGLKLGQKAVPGTLRYGRILFYCDQDYDGYSIVGLLINFLYKFWPELFEHNMIYKVETPIVVCQNKAKKKISFYTQQEYLDWLKKVNPKEWEIKYKKGLAALVDDEYKDIIHTPKLTKIKKDDISSESLNIWFGKESDLRKTELLK
jgi:DNA topoisomerase-2